MNFWNTLILMPNVQNAMKKWESIDRASQSHPCGSRGMRWRLRGSQEGIPPVMALLRGLPGLRGFLSRMNYTERHKFCRMLGRRRLSEFREAHLRIGKRLMVPASMILVSFRPFGPHTRCFKAPPNIVARPKSFFACGIICDALYSMHSMLARFPLTGVGLRSIALRSGAPVRFEWLCERCGVCRASGGSVPPEWQPG